MTFGSGALAGIRILVVDDHPDALDAIASLLEMNGAEVRRCRSASEARGLFTTFRADLVVSDLAMPGEDGFDLIMSIRKLSADKGGATPAIAFSASDDPFARARALECGFQAFVPKIRIDELLRAVASLAARGRG